MIKGGKKLERHLCEQCARQQGVSVGGVGGATPITQLLTQFITAPGQGAPKPAPGGQAQAKPTNMCPSCGLGYAQFRNNGLLGCPDCYVAFEGQLAPLLARAHEGGTHHTGKRAQRLRNQPETARPASSAATPNKADDAEAEFRSKVAATRRRLNEAVAAEQYELAAKLRDELAGLEGRRPPTPPGGRTPPHAEGSAGDAP